jgi:PAS domain-containing protein
MARQAGPSRGPSLMDTDGEVVGWFGMARDVTARKRASLWR